MIQDSFHISTHGQINSTTFPFQKNLVQFQFKIDLPRLRAHLRERTHPRGMGFRVVGLPATSVRAPTLPEVYHTEPEFS